MHALIIFFFTDIGGYGCERVRQNLLWNRVANTLGRQHGNVPLDLVNEHLNLDFKSEYISFCNFIEKLI